jgi:hypothetical protein
MFTDGLKDVTSERQFYFLTFQSSGNHSQQIAYIWIILHVCWCRMLELMEDRGTLN